MPTSAPTLPPAPAVGTRTGPRVVAAPFFTRARAAQALTTELPPLVDGDCASCPDGLEWWRCDGRWVRAGRLGGPGLPDEVVAAWWQQRGRPDSRFAVVHQLAPGEVRRITAPRYTSRFLGLSLTGGEFIREEDVTGDQLRDLVAYAAVSRSSSAHLELPSGIVTLHSDSVGDVFFLPLSMGSRRAPTRRGTVRGTPPPWFRPAEGTAVSWFHAGESRAPDPSAAADGGGTVDGSPSTTRALPRRAAGGPPPRREP